MTPVHPAYQYQSRVPWLRGSRLGLAGTDGRLVETPHEALCPFKCAPHLHAVPVVAFRVGPEGRKGASFSVRPSDLTPVRPGKASMKN